MISQEEEKIIEAVGWTLTCHSPMEMEHEDGSTATGFDICMMVIKNAIEEYQEMKREESIEDEKSKKASATASLNLENINGREILEFLTDQIENNEELCDSCIGVPLEFESQSVGKNSDGELMYSLVFSAEYNNWSVYQKQEGQKIQITNDSVRVLVTEAFEDYGSDEELENVLREWLKTHTFSNDSEKKFDAILRKAFGGLSEVDFKDKEDLKKVIEQLENAYTYMK